MKGYISINKILLTLDIIESNIQRQDIINYNTAIRNTDRQQSHDCHDIWTLQFTIITFISFADALLYVLIRRHHVIITYDRSDIILNISTGRVSDTM